MKQYTGIRVRGKAVVTVNDQLLNPRFDLRSHSPNGFEWGYSGSGPAQLALAILADHFGNPDQALAVYQDFKFQVIAALKGDDWRLTSDEIQQQLERLRSAKTKPPTDGGKEVIQ